MSRWVGRALLQLPGAALPPRPPAAKLGAGAGQARQYTAPPHSDPLKKSSEQDNKLSYVSLVPRYNIVTSSLFRFHTKMLVGRILPHL